MTPTPEDIAREAPLERVTRWLHHESCGLLPSFEWPGPGVCACKATVAALISEAIRSAVQAEKAKTEAIVNAELQTAAVSVSRGIQLGREEATRRYETVVEVLTRTLERLRSRGDK